MSALLFSACSDEPAIDDQATGTEERPDVIPGGPDDPMEPEAPVGTLFSARNADGVSIQYAVTGPDECELKKGQYEGHIAIPDIVSYRGRQYKVTGIEKLAFANSFESYAGIEYYTGITSVSIPATIRQIGEGAFLYCRIAWAEYASIASMCQIGYADGNSTPLQYAEQLYVNGEAVTDIVVPSTVEAIGNFAFAYSQSISSVTLSEGVRLVGDYAFIECDALHTVVLPQSLTAIGEAAFCNCRAMESILIPQNVSLIGERAFQGTYLKAVKLQPTVPPTCFASTFASFDQVTPTINMTLRVPQGSLDAYRHAEVWKDFNSIKEYGLDGRDLINDNDLLIGTWCADMVGRQVDYMQFTEDYRYNSWSVVTDTETGTSSRIDHYKDVPYTYDAGTMILTLYLDDNYTAFIRLIHLSDSEFSTDDPIRYSKVE